MATVNHNLHYSLVPLSTPKFTPVLPADLLSHAPFVPPPWLVIDWPALANFPSLAPAEEVQLPVFEVTLIDA